MKLRFKIACLFLICIGCTVISAQHLNIEILGKLSYENNLSDVWGYTTNNTEYALVGVQNGVSIVDVSNPSDPKEIQFVEGAFANARDIKTYKNFAYSTNGKEEGILIIDLNELPNKVTVKKFTGNKVNTFTASHNLFIDELGFLYVAGHNINPGGLLIFDLKTGSQFPELVGTYNDNYVHDVYAKENILYTSEGDRMAIIDASDKNSLKILGTQQTYGYTHNSWLSENEQILFTTDETSGTWVVAWDVSSPADIMELSKAQSTIGGTVIPHNAIWLNNYLVTSFYTDGVVIFDATNPKALVKVAQVDTAPQFSGDGFNGCWGVYPFLPSGNILATDIEEGLYILKAKYKRAANLIGIVTDSLSNNPIENVKIAIKNEDIETTTSVMGNYLLGLANEGIYEVKFSKPGYFSKVVFIEFINGETIKYDIILTKDENFVPTDIIVLSENVPIVNLSENPFSNEIEFSTKNLSLLSKDNEVHFFSIDGQLLGKKNLTNEKITWGSKVSAGIYHYTININNLPVYSGKIIKIK